VSDRYFSPEEVEALIPALTAIMERVRAALEQVAQARGRRQAEERRIAMAGGGVFDRAQWAKDTAVMDRATAAVRAGLEEIVALGGVPKDLDLGLVDFPHRRDGADVELCWKFGETTIGFWHGLGEGFAGRKPL
jgi:hypothetical protein